MARSLDILVIAADAQDGEALLRALREAGFEPEARRVDGETEYLAALERPPEVVLAGRAAPPFDASCALDLLRDRGVDVPVVVVGDAPGEEPAVEFMRRGAADYLFRGNLARLGRAVERALAERRSRQDREAQAGDILLRNEKLATMNELLAGVAHELNNPLSVVLGQAKLLAARAGPGPLAERALKIAGAAETCARIVRNFVTLARRKPSERRKVALNGIVKDALELLAYPLRVDGVAVTLDLAADVPPLWGDPDRLCQMLVNLIANAHHAMRAAPPPRTLTLATRWNAERGRIELSVADSGPGIPPELRERVFEPFYTTRGAGEGTGLGLPVCRSIVGEHRGTIRVEGAPGSGARFCIELPPESRAKGGEGDGDGAAPGLCGKAVLVVDDEAVFGELIREALAADGHRVDVVASGAEALVRLEQGAYDLIVSDLRMPGLDGAELYRRVAAGRPELRRRFVFVTGDVLGAESNRFLAQAGAPSLHKPFAPEALREAVRKALRES